MASNSPTKANLDDGSLLLEVRHVSKSFPGVRALQNVDLTLARGEIHALVGENGAGKSTLVNIIAGRTNPDAGSIEMHLDEIAATRSADERVSLLPQDLLSVPTFSLGRNLLLGREERFVGRSLGRRELRAAREALAHVGADIDPTQMTSDSSVSAIRLMQIARTLDHPGNVVVLDEPTAVLSDADADAFLRRLVELKREHRGVVYVSHRLGEIFEICDRVTVLRDGEVVGTWATADIDRDTLVRVMSKKPGQVRLAEVRESFEDEKSAHRRLRVAALSTRPGQSVSLDVRAGEIVGIAGVQGSGYSAVVRAIAGLQLHTGTVEVDHVVVRGHGPRQRYHAGISLVPGDRRHSGIVPLRSIRENIVLPDRTAAARWGLRIRRREQAISEGYRSDMSIKSVSVSDAVGTLSGGNQQKVAIARALEAAPEVLLLEEPTQGIDVNAKEEVRVMLLRLARERGLAIVIATADFEELIGLADRIHVIREGEFVAELGASASYGDVLHHALG